MQQPVADAEIATRYATDVDDVWRAWEPTLHRCAYLLSSVRSDRDHQPAALATELRRAQYRVHTAAELAAGCIPPASAADAHALLVDSLGSCRDALGVIAVRADLAELDDDVARLGVQAIELTRDAFSGARSSSRLVHAWVAEDRAGPDWLLQGDAARRTPWSFALWLALSMSAALCIVVLVELAQRAS